MSEKRDYYEVLGLAKGAGKSDIKSFDVTSKNATGGPHMLSDNAVSPLLAGNTPSEL